MDCSGSQNLTQLIHRAMDGDGAAYRRVFEITYRELKQLAHRQSSEPINTTALVHESFLRFIDAGQVSINDRNHFLNYACRVMRSVVVDAARARNAQRRGGEFQQDDMEMERLIADAPSDEAIAVHEALEKLADVDERMVRVVEMRYFAGMTEPEIAEALETSERTVRRIWERARIWLADAMS